MQLSVRFEDRALEKKLRQLADRHGVSLNKAAVLLLRTGAGLQPGGRAEKSIGRALDKYFGVWTEEEAREFDRSMQIFETVDEDLWR